jgi:hypothetical protein
MVSARWIFWASITKATPSPASHNLVSLSEPHSRTMPQCKFCGRSSRTSVLSSQCSVPTFRRSDPDTPCFACSSRHFVLLCSSQGRMCHRFHDRQPNPSRMPPLWEVKLLVPVSSVDCQATWLRIVLISSRPKELISSSAHKGSKTSPTARSTM